MNDSTWALPTSSHQIFIEVILDRQGVSNLSLRKHKAAEVPVLLGDLRGAIQLVRDSMGHMGQNDVGLSENVGLIFPMK